MNDGTTVPSGSSLQLTSNGILSLRNYTGEEIWSSKNAGSAYASMNDKGNFVIYGAYGKPRWDSFDAPADTILPTQELPSGKFLQAKLMGTDYSNGRFTLSLDTNGNLSFYPVVVPSGFRYDAYWSTNTTGNDPKLIYGVNGRIYLTLDNGTQHPIMEAGLNSTENLYHWATLGPDGILRQYTYPKGTGVGKGLLLERTLAQDLPKNICRIVYTEFGSGVCGYNSYCRYNWNQTECICPQGYSFFDVERKYKGCKPEFAFHSCDLSDARVAEQFQMVPMESIDWPLRAYEEYHPINQSTCQKLCLTDCFCYAAVFDQGGYCWKKQLPLSNGREGVKFKQFSSRMSRKKRIPSQPWSRMITRAFSYKELEEATDGFNAELGRGSSGTVYKGNLHDGFGTSIAVKKIDRIPRETEKEFTMEVETIGHTFHKNLIQLLGFCYEGTERLLVYPFMANGSLTKFLFSGMRPSWDLRVDIAHGLARGLLYLHEECGKQIIHCDIKPENILLDDNFVAKISDFGLAKLLKAEQTQTSTGIRGTRGYFAPEWFKNMGISSKVDVYSFGVVLLEIICSGEMWTLRPVTRTNQLDLLVEDDKDAVLNMKMVERFITVALWCIQDEPAVRPTMLKANKMLDGAIEAPQPPLNTQPS
uniref:non-specific serine/threonine protein kinase n=1 Tax=Oryza punctata TaxID=4537 RepID=A0A0E0KRU5_ORYPU